MFISEMLEGIRTSLGGWESTRLSSRAHLADYHSISLGVPPAVAAHAPSVAVYAGVPVPPAVVSGGAGAAVSVLFELLPFLLTRMRHVVVYCRLLLGPSSAHLASRGRWGS